MFNENLDIKKKGEDGECFFQDWLNSQEIRYLRINQGVESLSHLFAGAIKRPDFLVFIPSIGFIAVDVKHHDVSNYKTFTLNIESEIAKAAAFEHLSRQYLWYAYKDARSSENAWHFISAQTAMELGEKKNNQKTKESFLAIDIKHFTSVKTVNDIPKLFNARIGTIGKFARFIKHGLKSIKI